MLDLLTRDTRVVHHRHMTNTTHTAGWRNMPALEGEPVLDGHLAICRDYGHATHTVDGIDTGRCPRCGEVTENVEAFDRILDLEAAVRISHAVRSFTGAGVPEYRKAQTEASITADEARLSAALDALTPAELAAFGPYRAAAMRGES